jgi:transcriptional regulator with XRE-family HTH domain
LTLKELRLSRLLTQNQIAAGTGVTQQTVAFWEKGKRRPQLPQMAALAKFFDLTPAEIVGIMDETQTPKDG